VRQAGSFFYAMCGMNGRSMGMTARRCYRRLRPSIPYQPCCFVLLWICTRTLLLSLSTNLVVVSDAVTVVHNNNLNNNIVIRPLLASPCEPPPPPAAAKLLVRQIRSQSSNITFVEDVLSRIILLPPRMIINNNDINMMHSYSSVVVEALGIFGKSHRPDLVLDWYYRWDQYCRYLLPLQNNQTIATAATIAGALASSNLSSPSSSSSTIDESVRIMAISALGCCGRHLDAVQLLPTPTENDDADDGNGYDRRCRRGIAGSYNAAIAACKVSRDWKLALHIFEERIPPKLISTITVNAMMSVLVASRQGNVALDLLLNRLWPIPSEDDDNDNNDLRNDDNGLDDRRTTRTIPSAAKIQNVVDGVTLQLVTNALIRSNEVDQAYNLLCLLSNLTEKERLSLKLNASTIGSICDLVSSAYGRQSYNNNREAIEHVDELRRHEIGEKHARINIDRTRHQFQHWGGLEKINKGKEAYWVVGTYHPLNITVGLHPNRNPGRNGIQMVFYINHQKVVDSTGGKEPDSAIDGIVWTRSKIGYLLMQNSLSENEGDSSNKLEGRSSLLGMFLDPTERGKGLAKICLAIWMWFCLHGRIEPCTGIIRKPLVALALQHTFGFVPVGDDGVDVELCHDPNCPRTTILYCPSGKCLEGAFSPWDLEKQCIRLESTPPAIRGRKIRVGCSLSPPSNEAVLLETVQKYIESSDDNNKQSTTGQLAWECHLTKSEIRQLFLGV
jgi:hypothetical protein